MKNNPSAEDGRRIVTDSMPVGATRCSPDRRFLWVNPTYAKWAGRDAQDLVGRPMADVLGAHGMREIEPFIQRVLAGEQVQFERFVELPGRPMAGSPPVSTSIGRSSPSSRRTSSSPASRTS
jgi:PAS domain-containing protein